MLKLLVELTGPPMTWHLSSQHIYVVAGRLRRWLPVGCLVCVERTGPAHASFQAIEEDDDVWCASHGPLRRLEFAIRNTWEVAVGDVVVRGQDKDESPVYVPLMMPARETRVLMRRLVEETCDHYELIPGN